MPKGMPMMVTKLAMAQATCPKATSNRTQPLLARGRHCSPTFDARPNFCPLSRLAKLFCNRDCFGPLRLIGCVFEDL